MREFDTVAYFEALNASSLANPIITLLGIHLLIATHQLLYFPL